MTKKAQHAILRFAKHKAGPAGALEAHHERTKEKYASNPDIDITRSKDNFHIIQPEQKYRREIENRIKAAGCRTRKDSTMFVDRKSDFRSYSCKCRKEARRNPYNGRAILFPARKPFGTDEKISGHNRLSDAGKYFA